MSVLTQLAPTSASINGEATGDYVNQLTVSGVVMEPVVFVTYVSSPALNIASNGALNTTGTLEDGTYTSSGTVSDADGNDGTWTFTLTVYGVPGPQVSLVPQIPVPPTGAEIAVPFQIDTATGGVAVLTDYSAIIEQHVATIIMTALTERVMLPTYGSGLQNAVFRPINGPSDALLAKDIQTAITTWEPAIQVASVTVTGNPQSLSELDVLVSYSIAPSNDVNTVLVTSGGTISQVTAL